MTTRPLTGRTRSRARRLPVILAGLTLAVALAPARAAAPGQIETVAGAGRAGFSGDGGSARTAQLDQPRALAVDRAGTLYIADTFNHRIRRVTATGDISTVAGTGVAGYSGDGGPATGAQIHWPQGVALSPDDALLYVADTPNHRIRRVDLAGGLITTVAGNGHGGFDGDGGPATAARLSDPKALVVGPAGDLFIADTGNDRIRRVDPAGTITTVAGDGTTGPGGDGGPAAAAQFDGPRGLALDSAGNLFVADDNNDRVRRIDPAGTITTVAGSAQGDAGDGDSAALAQLNRPRGVAVDLAGNLYIADSMNHRVRVVGPSGVITTLAGVGRQGYGGDGGPAADAKLFSPRGIASDQAGNVYVADTYNDRVRRIQGGG